MRSNRVRRCSVSLLVSFAAAVTCIPLGETVVVAAPADDVREIGDGLEDLVGQLGALPGVDSLAERLPFTAKSPAQLAGISELLAGLKTQLAGFSGTTAGELDAFLDDPDGNGDPANDGSFSGNTLDVAGTVTGGSPYSISVTLTMTGDGISTPFLLTGPDANADGVPDSLIGGSYSLDLDTTLTVAATFDPAQAPGQRLRVTTAGGTLTFGGTAPLSGAAVRLGILNAQGDGSITVGGSVVIAVVDPDDSGSVTIGEIRNTASSDLFSAAYGSFSASGLVNLTSAIPGLDGSTATVTVAGSTPAATTATFNLGAFADFQNASPLDVISAIAQLGSSLGAMQTSGLVDVQLPFTSKTLGELVDLAAPIKKFLIGNGITSAADPLSPGSGASFIANLAKYDTLDEITALLGNALGLTGPVPVSYDLTTKRLRFGVASTFTAAPTFAADLSDEVAQIGIVSVTSGASTATIDATAALNLSFGIDLTPPAPGQGLIDRLFLDSSGTNELSIDLPASANVEAGAMIGFVGLNLSDANSAGAVPILTKRASDSGSMLRFDLLDGPNDDGILTLPELFGALEAPSMSSLAAVGTLQINAAIPPTAITATATASGATLARGTFTIASADITAGPPTVTADGGFKNQLLDFAFDASNPLALFNRVLDAVGAAVDGFDTVIAGSAALNATLPVIGTSFEQIADKFDELRASLNAVTSDPGATLQVFEGRLEEIIGDALGITGDRSSLLTFALDTSGPATAITVSLNFGMCSAAGSGCTTVVPLTKPFNIGVGSNSFVGVSGSGDLSLDYAATIRLDAGIELPAVTAGQPPTASGAATPFILDTTHVSLQVGANASSVFNAYVGPLAASIGTAGDPAVAKVGASFQIGNTAFGGTAAGDRVPLSQVGNFLAGALPTSILPQTPVSCAGVPGSFAACAKLPVYFNGTDLGDITFTAPDLLDPSGWTLDTGTVLDNLTSQAWDFTTLLTGLQAVLEQIDKATDGQNFGASIPIVGDALDAGADIAGAFNDNVVAPINNVLAQFNAQSNAGALTGLIDTTLTDALSAAGLLIGRGAAGPADDVEVLATCTGNVPCAATATLANIVGIEVRASIGAAATTDLTFDLGLPGLSLKVNSGAMQASADWRIDLAFGISRTEGFYLRTDNPISGAANPELTLTAAVDLPDSLYGTLAFIPVNLIDQHSGNDLNLGLGVNLTSSAGKLSLGQLVAGLDPGVGIAINVSGGLNMDLHFVTGLSPSEVANFGADAPSLPVFTGDFRIGWSFGGGAGTDIEAFASATDPTISIDDVTLDVGSFASDFLRPIAGELDRFVKPLKPVLDTLNAPIPGIKELSELLGMSPPTMLDMIDLQNGPDSTVMIRRLIILVDFITALNGPNGGNGTIALGGLKINADAARGAAVPSTEAAQKLIDGVVNGLPAPLQAVTNKLSSALASKLGTATDRGGFTFPAFDNPKSLLSVLVGQDVDIIRFDAGELKAEFTKAFKFGPPIGPVPVSVGATVSFKVTGHLEVGYDTRGIRLAIQRLTNDDPTDDGFFGKLATLLQGVYFDDNKNGVDVPEIALFGGVSVQAALDVLVLEAGIRGGVAANVDLNLHDGGPLGDEPHPKENLDGKLRIEEIIQSLSKNPLCLFDTSGRLYVFLELYEKNILTGEDTWPLADATLVNFDGLFDKVCAGDPPKLAHVEPDGTLVLHVGPFANLRGFEETEVNELMTVRKTGGDGTTSTVSVTGFGVSQDYSGVTRVFADGGTGNDNLAMLAGGSPVITQDAAGNDTGVTSTAVLFDLPTQLCGGDGNDVLSGGDAVDVILGDGVKAGGGFTCVLTAGSGNDTITGGLGDDQLSGQGGLDTISGGLGADTIFGDAGDDMLNGGAGNDTISGGDDADTVIGGDDADMLNGDAGNDKLSGGRGNDTINGGAGDDAADGADGADTINGDAGHDVLLGGPDLDTIHGNDGDDDLSGDAGDDLLYGDAGRDDIIGGAGNDQISGGDDRDYVLGDDGTIVRGVAAEDGSITPGSGQTGDDTINGDSGNDVLYGQRGNDQINGGEGDDLMYGGDGVDVMNGDAGADWMLGEAGDDLMHGNAGADLMRGGDGADTMFGDSESDVIFGDSGADRIEGGTEDDNVFGGIGQDCVAGNSGSDTLAGDGQNDRMAGGSFTAGQPDAADTMDGGGGDDVIAGDNADICGTALVLHDQPFLGGAAPDPLWSGNDALSGGDGDDVIYGQGHDETLISGGLGNDYVEGNAGNDVIDGGEGDDDLIGGNGHDLGGAGGTKRSFPNVSDANDIVRGGPGSDLIAGDNADIERLPTRTIVLFDVPFVGATVLPDASGDDELFGDAGTDTAYGQGGNDLLDGGDAADYLEGNDGTDTVNGADGQDDIVGGSGRDDGPASPGVSFRKLENVIDEGDALDGGADHDVILGDNGSIVRLATVGVDGRVDRNIQLYDVERIGGPAINPAVSGDEAPIIGGTGNDTIFGQGGNDLVSAGDGEDYVEGNHGNDQLYGGGGQDDLIGGGSATDGIIDADRVGDGLLDGDDLLSGDGTSAADAADEGVATGNGADVTMGDNARVIKRTDTAGTRWIIDDGSLDIVRVITQFDVEAVNQPAAPGDVHGNDTLYGNANDDVMRGQGGSDHMYGGAGDDDMEGNPEVDYMYGQSGQDDMIGGSRVGARRDAGDLMYGGADADFQLGDNGTLTRQVTGRGSYLMFVEANPTTIVRIATRFDVNGNPAAFGADQMYGDAGDDAQWGQDGNDLMYGGADNDDMLGELGADRMYGEDGQDAMLGDRGAVVNRLIDGSAGDPAQQSVSLNSPPAETFTYFRPGTLDRRVDMARDRNAAGTGFDATKITFPGTTSGGDDIMFGGRDHDSLHGGWGNDLMNGESGGDALFGDHGADVMWGGKGCDPDVDSECAGATDTVGLGVRGANDKFVDYLFGGYGGPPGSGSETAADILDYRPRPGVDPAIWFEVSGTTAGLPLSAHQHHQGTDWIYGGWDRDVLEADLAANGPNPGDRLIDWPGATQLFVHCNAAYGGFNDIRQHSPAMISFLERVAFANGAGRSIADVQASAESGFVDAGIVYTKDIKNNSGKAFSGTPGHYDQFSCAP